MLSIREGSRLDSLLDELCELSKNNDESMGETFARWSTQYLLNFEETTSSDIIDIHDAGSNIFFSYIIDDNDPYICCGKIIFDKKFKTICNKKHIEDFTNLFQNYDSKTHHDEYSKHIKQTCDVYVNLGFKIKSVIIVAGTINNDALDFGNEQIDGGLDLEIYSIDDILDQISRLPTKDLLLKYENSYTFKESTHWSY